MGGGTKLRKGLAQFGPIKIEFATTESKGDESTSTVNLALALSEVTTEDVTVDYAVTGGTASGDGVDYTLAGGTAKIPAGTLKVLIPVAVVDDTIGAESDETLIVTLSNPKNAELGAKSSTTYTIADNDSPDKEPAATVAAASAPTVVPMQEIKTLPAIQSPPQEPAEVEVSVCGDGRVEGPEECDDGNSDDADGCLISCMRGAVGTGTPVGVADPLSGPPADSTPEPTPLPADIPSGDEGGGGAASGSAGGCSLIIST